MPVVRNDLNTKRRGLPDLINPFLAKLAQDQLTDLNKQVTIDGKASKSVAGAWLADNGLTPRRRHRQTNQGQGRLDQLLRTGGPRRALRPDPRGERLHGQAQIPARPPPGRLPGPPEGRHRRPRRIRRDRPRARQQGRRRSDGRRRRDSRQVQGPAGAPQADRARPRPGHGPERLRRNPGDAGKHTLTKVSDLANPRRRGRPARHPGDPGGEPGSSKFRVLCARGQLRPGGARRPARRRATTTELGRVPRHPAANGLDSRSRPGVAGGRRRCGGRPRTAPRSVARRAGSRHPAGSRPGRAAPEERADLAGLRSAPWVWPAQRTIGARG